MKKYRLKKWYPSLDKKIEVGDIGDRYLFEFGNGTKEDRFSVLKGGRLIYIPIQELHPDFWELIEEENPKPLPLFITEDGVEINKNYGGWLYRISKDFKREVLPISPEMEVEGYKVFAHPESADEYIWRNKPVFSYEDFIRWGNVPYQRVIEQLAKERSKQ